MGMEEECVVERYGGACFREREREGCLKAVKDALVGARDDLKGYRRGGGGGCGFVYLVALAFAGL